MLRCLLLESQRYQVTVTEVVGWKLSMKNGLIIMRHHGAARGNACERMETNLYELSLEELKPRFAY